MISTPATANEVSKESLLKSKVTRMTGFKLVCLHVCFYLKYSLVSLVIFLTR